MANKEFKDNSKAVIQAVGEAIIRTLEICGGMAESFAKDSITIPGARDTSALFNSMDHTVDEEEQTAYIGSTLKNPAYGIYVEYGTGIYYEGGRRTSWTYQDREKRECESFSVNLFNRSSMIK